MPDYFEPETERTYEPSEAAVYEQAIQVPIATTEEIRQVQMEQKTEEWLEDWRSWTACGTLFAAKVVRERLLQSASA